MTPKSLDDYALDLSQNEWSWRGALKIYNEQADDYDVIYSNWDWRAPEECVKKLLNALKETGRSMDQIKILDCGCGTGWCGVSLRKMGFKGFLQGIDISEKSLDKASSKGIYNTLCISNMEKHIPLEDNSFDGIICTGVLSYVVDYERVFMEWLRLCNDGGIIVFSQKEYHLDENRTRLTGHLEPMNRLMDDNRWRLLEEIRNQPYVKNKTGQTYVGYYVFQKVGASRL